MKITRSTDFGQSPAGPGGGAGYTYEPITQIVAASSDPNPSPYTALNNDFLIVADASSQNAQVVLPGAAASKGQHKMVKRSDATFAPGNTVSLVTADGSQIEGASSLSLTAQNALVELKSDGTQWQVIGGQNSAAWGSTAAIAAITPGASPYTYTAPANGQVVISGGTVSNIQLKRGATTITIAAASPADVPVSAGDQVITTYSVVPTMSFVPR
ncbi:hypothetical protein C9I56_11200 [Paraburkholderia caribensis]|uniref:hypothetical protein n=1 Tax=Paraburkholderia caribensis TaxID=75105 RepID=UPI000D15AC38|nr:hypothetical protein [Paraburkholderia caribensis]PTB28849.1 hypothetical protein C9I56_11200 [Paraburkholderia caribensis]